MCPYRLRWRFQVLDMPPSGILAVDAANPQNPRATGGSC